MRIYFCFSTNQKVLAIELTQHEAEQLAQGLTWETKVSEAVEKACTKFFHKGTV